MVFFLKIPLYTRFVALLMWSLNNMCWIVEGIWYFEITPYWSITLIVPPLMVVKSELI
jgi:hypothetical protein